MRPNVLFATKTPADHCLPAAGPVLDAPRTQRPCLDLPTELLWAIFQLLIPRNMYSRKDDIRSCRLVCRRWSDVALEILYRDIQTSTWTLHDVPSEEYWTPTYLSFLRDNPHIGCHIRFARISLREAMHRDTRMLSPRVMRRLLQHAIRLEGLTLHHAVLRDTTRFRIFENRQPVPLRSLTIDFGPYHLLGYTQRSCDRELNDVFACFTGIRDLTLAGYRRTTKPLDVNPESRWIKRFPSELRVLTLRSSYLHRDLFDTIIASSSTETLRTLNLSALPDDTQDLQSGVNRLLAALGPGLRNITCSLEPRLMFAQYNWTMLQIPLQRESM